VTRAVAVTPSTVAVTSVVPAARPVTTPEVLTVATALLAVLQVMVFPEIAPPFASRTAARNCTEAPTGTVSDVGVSTTLLTVGATGSVGGGGSEDAPPTGGTPQPIRLVLTTRLSMNRSWARGEPL